MDSWHSYPSIYALGHKAIESLLSVEVNVEEKVDGSQFSLGLDDSGELHVRSKGKVMLVDAPEKMFTSAVETAKQLAPILHPGWTYRCEYLSKPKHNTLAYDRIPQKHLILFDVNTDHEAYLSYEEKAAEAARIGLEVVPLLFSGRLDSIERFRAFLDTDSVLGSQKIEGVVIKQKVVSLYGADHKALIGKFVSEAFKEVHQGAWKEANPTQGDIIERIIASYRTPARWQKAVQHLTEAGTMEGSPRDIPSLIKEVLADTEKECREEILSRLWSHAWPHIKRGLTRGLPEWWKDELVKHQFGASE